MISSSTNGLAAASASGAARRSRLGRGRLARRRLAGAPGQAAGRRGSAPAMLRSARLLAYASRLADLTAQVVQLGSVTSPTAATSIFVDLRRMQGECPLHAHPERLLTYRERLAHARALAGDADAFEDLNTLALALDHLEMHAHGVPGFEPGQLTQLPAFDIGDDVMTDACYPLP